MFPLKIVSDTTAHQHYSSGVFIIELFKGITWINAINRFKLKQTRSCTHSNEHYTMNSLTDHLPNTLFVSSFWSGAPRRVVRMSLEFGESNICCRHCSAWLSNYCSILAWLPKPKSTVWANYIILWELRLNQTLSSSNMKGSEILRLR